MFNEKKFRSELVLKGITIGELAKMLGISASTIHRKIQRGGAFNRDEISRIMDILELDDPREIFFDKNIT